MLSLAEFLTHNHEPFVYTAYTVHWMVTSSNYFLLQEGKTILGCIFASIVKTSFVVTLVVVDKDHRRKGYVRTLIQCLRSKYPHITSGVFLTKSTFGKELYQMKLYVLPYNNRAATLLGVKFNSWSPRYLKYAGATIQHYIGVPNDYMRYIIPYPAVIGTWYNIETNELSSVRYFEFRINGNTLSVAYLTYSRNPDEYADAGYHSTADVLLVYSRENLGYPFTLVDDKITVRSLYTTEIERDYLEKLPIQLF